MAAFIFIFILLLLVPDSYIWFFYIRGAVPLFWSIAYWLPTMSALAMVAIAASGYFNDLIMKTFFIVLLCIAMPKLIFMIVSFMTRSLAFIIPQISAHVNFYGNISGAVLAGITSIAFIYGLAFGWKQLKIKNLTIAVSELPASFDGYRIAQISDLHVGTYGKDTAFLDNLVDRINSLKPDMIVFTGDLVNSAASEIEPFKNILSGLYAKDGIYSVLGNHDYCEYNHYDTPDGASNNLAEVIKLEKSFGWQILQNEHKIIYRDNNESIYIIGVDNIGLPPFPSKGDLQRAIDGIPAGAFKILLSHDPTHWRVEVLPETNIQLTLSGHTHAMQLKVFGFSPSSLKFKEWGGLYRSEDDRFLNVSTGAGGNIHFRLGAWPEVNLITLIPGS